MTDHEEPGADFKDCSACGFPMASEADRCPRCGVSQRQATAFVRWIWKSLLICLLLMLLGALFARLLSSWLGLPV